MAGSTYGTIFRIMTWGSLTEKASVLPLTAVRRDFRFVRKMFRFI